MSVKTIECRIAAKPESLQYLWELLNVQMYKYIYGEGGIRTPVRFDPKIVFETTAFNHSATSPGRQNMPPCYFTEIWVKLTRNFLKSIVIF